MLESRYSDNNVSKRDIPSFIEPRPPLIQNPFMRPRPQKGTNLLELFEEDSEIEEPEWVQVYLRLKPCRIPNTLYEVRSDRCLVTSLDTATAGHGRRTQHNVSKMYTFSKIFGSECNQKEIFEDVVKENLRKLPDGGQNFTLLTYGASGSGKTYTLMGTVGAPGLVPRSLEYVFRLVDAAQQPMFRPAENGAEKLSHPEQDYELQWVKRLRHISAPLRDKYRRMSVQLHNDLTISSIDLSNRIRHYVWVSFVEIYNEAVYDLLAPPERRTKLRIREDASGNVYVKGATQAFVRSGEEAYDVMVAGRHNLVVAATGVHAQSSRSHCIFTITMLTETTEGSVRTSYVRLCDLAGCERARATRNTGARMQESRAINSSLHVLERCLHMLRRKQKTRNDTMVPYRESKLTRLLGTGLSGTRGEAVSIVVTLNPSPEYAHETKHVLSLAAVAQDIQVNNTLFTTTLESSTQDTTINCSSEVMKLRSDNERLHFELVQAQARNKELMASTEERQQESANIMRELVEEAKDLTKQYYEAQLEALRCEMEDMVEEYESRLAKVQAPQSSGSDTPSRILQNKVSQLMTEIAVLEEKLTAEHLARARAEKEVQHLRTCIEERDEKAFKDTTPPREDVMSLTDSEHESDEETSDPFNESLEPILKKELNRSISIAKQNDKLDSASIHTIDNIDEECDSDLEIEKSHETLKNDDSKNSTYTTGEDEDDDSSKKIDATNENVNVAETFDRSVKTNSNAPYNNEIVHVKYDNSFKKDTNTYGDEIIAQNKCDNSLKKDANTTLSYVTYNSEIVNKKYDDSLEKDTNTYGDEIIAQNKCDDSLKKDTNTYGDEIIAQNKCDDSSKKETNTYGDEIIAQNKCDDSLKKDANTTYDNEINYDKYNENFKNDTRNEYNNLSENNEIQFKNESIKSNKLELRGTYFVKDDKFNDTCDFNEDAKETKTNSFRGTYFVKDPLTDVSKSSDPDQEKPTNDLFKAPIVRDTYKVPEKVSENLTSRMIKEKSNIDMRAPEKVPESQMTKIIREKSKVDLTIPQKVSEDLSSKIFREKPNIDMRAPVIIPEPISRILWEKSKVDMTIPDKESENPSRKIIRETSTTDMRAPEILSEPPVSKIIREKSKVDITVPDKLSENLSRNLIREKSNNDMRAPEKIPEPKNKIIREKSKVDMTVPEKLSENLFSKIIGEKSNIDMKAPEPQVSKIREKSNVEMTAPKKVPENLVNKIMRSFQSKKGSDVSLRQFEQLEEASKACNDDKQNQSIFGNIKMLKEKRTYFDSVSDDNKVSKEVEVVEPVLVKEKRTYFDNIGPNVATKSLNKRMDEIMKSDEERSPSIVKDVVSDDFEPSTIKKLLGESFTKPDVMSSIHKTRLTKKHNSLDIFEAFDSPIASKTKEIVDNVEIARQSIEKLVLDQQSAKKTALAPLTSTEPRLSIREVIEPDHYEVQKEIKKEIKLEPMSSVEEANAIETKTKKVFKLEPTRSIDEPNQTMNEAQAKGDNTMEEFENIYKDISAPRATEFDLLAQEINESAERHEKEEMKYNLRKKHSKNDDTEASKSKVRKRPLRLRRKKNQDEETDDKLQDIVNLQSEFSDVTIDVPAPQKVVKDIPSPEKGEDENLPPSFGIQSCPSKMLSVTRSRRKLFTPRAEPLEESLTQTEDSNERIYVPRPSYHRPRARRKL